MSESSKGVVSMVGGPLAEVTFHADGTYEVNRILRKASGLTSGTSVAEVGKLIANMPLDEHGTARVDLV